MSFHESPYQCGLATLPCLPPGIPCILTVLYLCIALTSISTIPSQCIFLSPSYPLALCELLEARYIISYVSPAPRTVLDT